MDTEGQSWSSTSPIHRRPPRFPSRGSSHSTPTSSSGSSWPPKTSEKPGSGMSGESGRRPLENPAECVSAAGRDGGLPRV